MSDSQDLVYVSRRTLKSLWQEYRVYADRIELQSWFAAHTLIIPVEELLDVQIRPRFIFIDLFRGKGLAYAFLPLKNDCADFCRHVAVKRKFGFLKNIRIAPDDPDMFIEACKSVMKKN